MADAEDLLRVLLKTILDEKDYKPRDIKIKGIKTDAPNYTSALFFINVSSSNRSDLELFAKVACIGEAMRVHMHADWLFDTERFVYTKLVKIYEDIQNETQVPEVHRYVFPQYYGCNAELEKEILVLENLNETGYKSYSGINSMDWDHASVAIENLAKFHALSFAYEQNYPEEFEKLTSNMPYRLISQENEEPSESKVALWLKIVDNALDVIKEEQRDAVKTFVLDKNVMKKYNKPIGKPVIVHGDYKLNNLLFRRLNDSLQSIAVDYQTVHAGCPAGDLIYFIFLGSDEEFRSQYYTKLLDHYHSSLQRALERLSVDPNVYSREKLDSDMKELLPYAVLIGVMILPVVTVEAAAAPKVDGDADVKGFLMKPSELYAQRFSGIVNDCIRWGAI